MRNDGALGTSKHMALGALLHGGFLTGSREAVTGYKIYDGKTPKPDVLSRLGRGFSGIRPVAPGPVSFKLALTRCSK